ncbi:NF-kappa-B inhibitor cactus [Anopheles maculipalpis]|uniref:NF-kappa-B inhibitor cactus n=1 Tax=Anopheles maculipalpis TaxID=1496333 RepID=UPI0021593015|nr:NF-kappa-B inhibitor cactus [Anopheles maculipalpis]
MHPSRGGAAMNIVSTTDSSGQSLCEKKDYADSANADSGFLSGHNLNLSENIVVEQNHSEDNPTYSGTYRSASSAKQIIEANSNLDSGMIPDEEELESRDLGLSDICERFDRLMKRDWMKSYQQDEMGETQLHMAVYERNEDNITKLIANLPRQFLNIQNDDAQTALHLAVLTDQPQIVRRLLNAGVDQTIRDVDGNTALHLACGLGKVKMVKELLAPISFNENPQGPSQTEAVQDIELWNYDGKTCVHLAAEAGSIEAIRSLIDAGADINAREGKSGMSPLHISIAKGNENLANFLLDECPLLSLETTTYAGMTAYQLALIQDKRILISDLTKRGAEQISLPESDVETDTEDETISNYYGPSAFSSAFSGLSAINVS